jgi:uncharacterized protein (TIGR04255 family)
VRCSSADGSDAAGARFRPVYSTDVAEPKQLRNPPISEALIDIRTPVRADITAQTFAQVRERLKERFPRVDEQHAFETQFGFHKAEPITASKDLGFHGLHFRTPDGQTVAQFRRDGFTVNRLRPYQGWQQLFELAIELFPLFCEAADVQHVSRIAVRYINHLNLPIGPGTTLTEYLTSVPPAPPGLPAILSGFLARVSLFEPKETLQAHFTQSLETVTDAEFPKVLMDIDAFAAVAETVNVRELVLAEELEKLRQLKTRIFFAALTERAVELLD